ncbi:hypothetical protein Hanom_Chr02g00166071 [Helianthus anomalus]
MVKVVTSQLSRIVESVVIKWMEKSILVRVSESPERWVLSFDDESASESSDSESASEADSAETQVNMEDDEEFEEGEIRMDETHIPVPEVKVVTPVDEVQGAQGVHEKSSEKLERSEFQKTPVINVGIEEPILHGDVDRQMHVSNNAGDGDVSQKDSHNNGGPVNLSPGENLN